MNYKKILTAFFTVGFVLLAVNRDMFPIVPEINGQEQAKKSPTRKADYEVKVGIISTIIRFCKWPPHSPISRQNGDIIVGTFEEDEVISYFIERTKKRKIRGKTVKLVVIEDLEKIKECNLLFINNVSKKRLKKILEIVDDLPVLTVADEKDFAKKGVMISMYNTSNKLAFNVNQTSLLKSGLILHSKILSLADEIF